MQTCSQSSFSVQLDEWKFNYDKMKCHLGTSGYVQRSVICGMLGIVFLVYSGLQIEANQQLQLFRWWKKFHSKMRLTKRQTVSFEPAICGIPWRKSPTRRLGIASGVDSPVRTESGEQPHDPVASAFIEAMDIAQEPVGNVAVCCFLMERATRRYRQML